MTALQRCHCAAEPEAKWREAQEEDFFENNPVKVIVCSDLRVAGWEEVGVKEHEGEKEWQVYL